MSRVGKFGLLGLIMVLSAAPLMALDANDIRNMLQNGVQESVIISMLQNQKLFRPLSTQEVIDLNQYGASATLLEQLTHASSVDGSYSTTYVSTITPAPTIVQSPTVVTTSPQVIYTEPSTVYYSTPYYGTPYRYYNSPGFSFYFGSGRRHWGGPPRWGPGPGYRPGPPHGRPPGGRPGGGPRPGGPGGRPGGGRPGGPGPRR